MNRPSLTVSLPCGFFAERTFVLSHLLERIMGYRVNFQVNADSRDTLYHIGGGGKELVLLDSFFAPLNEERFSYGASLLPSTPVVLASGGSDFIFPFGSALVEEDEARLVCHADMVASALFMLSRWEEALLPRDAFGRPDEREMWVVRHGLCHRPLVDEYVQLLEQLLARCGVPIPQREARYRAMLTHDIDYLFRYGAFSNLLRNVAGDVLHRHSPRLLARTVKRYIAYRLGRRRDPHDTFDFLMDVSDAHGLRSVFYFKAAHAGEYDATYDIRDPRVRRIIRHVQDRGHEVGFHPSKNTFGNPAQFALEAERLRAAGVDSPAGGRQHFLLYDLPASLRAWEQQGFRYDAGLGFAHRGGFRCGTSHPYRFFDAAQRRVMELEIRPLIAMEGAIIDEQGDMDCAEREICNLMAECRKHSGLFVFLWHNDFASRRPLHEEKLLALYQRVVARAAVESATR